MLPVGSVACLTGICACLTGICGRLTRICCTCLTEICGMLPVGSVGSVVASQGSALARQGSVVADDLGPLRVEVKWNATQTWVYASSREGSHTDSPHSSHGDALMTRSPQKVANSSPGRATSSPGWARSQHQVPHSSWQPSPVQSSPLEGWGWSPQFGSSSPHTRGWAGGSHTWGAHPLNWPTATHHPHSVAWADTQTFAGPQGQMPAQERWAHDYIALQGQYELETNALLWMLSR